MYCGQDQCIPAKGNVSKTGKDRINKVFNVFN